MQQIIAAEEEENILKNGRGRQKGIMKKNRYTQEVKMGLYGMIIKKRGEEKSNEKTNLPRTTNTPPLFVLMPVTLEKSSDLPCNATRQTMRLSQRKKNPKKSLNPTEKREMHEVFTKGIMVIAT